MAFSRDIRTAAEREWVAFTALCGMLSLRVLPCLSLVSHLPPHLPHLPPLPLPFRRACGVSPSRRVAQPPAVKTAQLSRRADIITTSLSSSTRQYYTTIPNSSYVSSLSTFPSPLSLPLLLLHLSAWASASLLLLDVFQTQPLQSQSHPQSPQHALDVMEQRVELPGHPSGRPVGPLIVHITIQKGVKKSEAAAWGMPRRGLMPTPEK